MKVTKVLIQDNVKGVLRCNWLCNFFLNNLWLLEVLVKKFELLK